MSQLVTENIYASLLLINGERCVCLIIFRRQGE